MTDKTDDELTAFLDANIYPDGTHCIGFREKLVNFVTQRLDAPVEIRRLICPECAREHNPQMDAPGPRLTVEHLATALCEHYSLVDCSWPKCSCKTNSTKRKKYEDAAKLILAHIDLLASARPLVEEHDPAPTLREIELSHIIDELIAGPSDAQIKYMADRFLGWKLPENFQPDAGISFKKTFNEHTAHPTKHEPSGTNLFDAEQALAMVRYMVAGLPRRLSAQPKETGWMPIPTEPCDVNGEYLVYWPAYKLDDDGNLTTIPAGRGYRGVADFINGQVNGEPEALGATGSFFGDDWEYGDPTHYAELMPPPSPEKAEGETP